MEEKEAAGEAYQNVRAPDDGDDRNERARFVDRQKVETVRGDKKNSHGEDYRAKEEARLRGGTFFEKARAQNENALEKGHINVVKELHAERVEMFPLQQELVVYAADRSEERAEEHGKNPDVREEVSGFLARSDAHDGVSGEGNSDAEPFHGAWAFAHERYGHGDCENRSARPDGSRYAQRQPGNGVERENPARRDDCRLEEKFCVSARGECGNVAQKVSGRKERRAREAHKKQNGENGVPGERLLFRDVVKSEE